MEKLKNFLTNPIQSQLCRVQTQGKLNCGISHRLAILLRGKISTHQTLYWLVTFPRADRSPLQLSIKFPWATLSLLSLWSASYKSFSYWLSQHRFLRPILKKLQHTLGSGFCQKWSFLKYLHSLFPHSSQSFTTMLFSPVKPPLAFFVITTPMYPLILWYTTLWKFGVCTLIWYTYILKNVFTIALANTSIMPHHYPFLFVVRHLKSTVSITSQGVIQCYQLWSSCRISDPQKVFILELKICTFWTATSPHPTLCPPGLWWPPFSSPSMSLISLGST